MATATEFSNWQNVWSQALALAGSNDSFRQALLEDASSALKAYLNVELPEAVPVHVVAISDSDHARGSVLAMPLEQAKKGEANVLARYARELATDAAPPCVC